MIVDREEITRSIEGTLRLLKGDRSGISLLNLSVDGFWNSFFAAVLVAPAYVIMLLLTDAAGPPSGLVGWRLLASGGLFYLVSWALMPILAFAFCRFFDLERRFVPLVVALNWSAVIQMAIFLPVLAVAALLPGVLGGVVLLVTTGALLYYQWFITTTALETSKATALGFIVVDLILNQTAQAMIKGWFQTAGAVIG